MLLHPTPLSPSATITTADWSFPCSVRITIVEAGTGQSDVQREATLDGVTEARAAGSGGVRGFRGAFHILLLSRVGFVFETVPDPGIVRIQERPAPHNDVDDGKHLYTKQRRRYWA
jgi:hypothetical protein